jgi:hypothetical protein
MSVRVMTLVWEKYPAGGSELLLMLALADWANDAGDRIYPSVGTIAKKVRQSERNVQRLLRRIEKSGWLEIVDNKHGGHGLTRRYRIPLEMVTTCRPSISDKGDSRGKKGDVRDQKGDMAVSPDPLVEPSDPSEEERMPGRQRPPVCPHQQIVELYHEKLPERRRHTSWDGTRRNNLEARWRWLLANTNPRTSQPYFRTRDEGLAWFKRFFEYCRESRFLMEGCRVFCLEWAVKKVNFHKILEGAYHDPDTQRTA